VPELKIWRTNIVATTKVMDGVQKAVTGFKKCGIWPYRCSFCYISFDQGAIIFQLSECRFHGSDHRCQPSNSYNRTSLGNNCISKCSHYSSSSSNTRPGIDCNSISKCSNRESAAPLVCPTLVGYTSLIEKLIEYAEHNKLPSSINLQLMDEGSGILSTLTTNNARYHKHCKNKYDSQKLRRLSSSSLFATVATCSSMNTQKSRHQMQLTSEPPVCFVMKERRQVRCSRMHARRI